MDLELWIAQMKQTAAAVRALVEGVPAGQARWRPDDDSWSILEVIHHLYDEEREDFRVRLDILLHRPEEPWPPIDPQGWVTARDYNSKDVSEVLESFLLERDRSIAWIEGLDRPDFDSFIESRFGRMTAGDMFASWLAHDLLHLRHLVEIHHAWRVDALSPYNPGYAGEI